MIRIPFSRRAILGTIVYPSWAVVFTRHWPAAYYYSIDGFYFSEWVPPGLAEALVRILHRATPAAVLTVDRGGVHSVHRVMVHAIPGSMLTVSFYLVGPDLLALSLNLACDYHLITAVADAAGVTLWRRPT